MNVTRVPTAVRLAEITYATVHAGVALYLHRTLATTGRPAPLQVYLVGWLPIALALALAATLRRDRRWPWVAAVGLALYVLVDGFLASYRLWKMRPVWPAFADLAVASLLVRMLAQALVLVVAAGVLRRNSSGIDVAAA